MREGELLALRWRDVDLDSATLQVRATLHHSETGFTFAEPKTPHSRRRVALPNIVVQALKWHHARQAEEKSPSARYGRASTTSSFLT
jgi:integrase